MDLVYRNWLSKHFLDVRRHCLSLAQGLFQVDEVGFIKISWLGPSSLGCEIADVGPEGPPSETLTSNALQLPPSGILT